MDKDNGGPAFPRAATPHQASGVIHGPQKGMSLRDYFAGQALASMAGMALFNHDAREATGDIAKANGTDRAHLIAATAYQMADAMIAVRKLARDEE